MIALTLQGAAYARDVKFEVELDRSKVSIGDTAELGLSFYGTQGMPAPDIGQISGLDIRYMGPSTMLTVINGQVSSSVTHRYRVQPLKVGKFQIGPFSFRYKGDDYSSNMVFLEAVEERLPKMQAPTPQQIKEEAPNIEDRAFIRLEIAKTTAYVNELIPIAVKLYSRIPLSEIQLPIFDQEGFSKAEFKDAKQYRGTVDGLVYDVLEFKTTLLGTRPGTFRIGPAKIKCNMIKRKSLRGRSTDDFFGDDSYRDSFFDDFFTRYERQPIELKSQDAQLIISPLPAENVPQDFSGAVGDYQFIYSASPTKVKVGDPITVRMTINGAGNFNTVFSPKTGNTDNFRLYEPQVKTEENSKTFTQVMIPESENIKEVPAASFSYFDTGKKEYKRIVQGPIAIQVEKAKEEAPSMVVGPPIAVSQVPPAEEALTRDIIYIKESPGRLLNKDYQVYKSKAFLILIVMPLAFIIALYLVEGRKNRLAHDSVYAGRVRAFRVSRKGVAELSHKLKSADTKIFYETLFKVLQDYLGNRVHVPSGGITADIVDHVLASKGIEYEVLAKIRKLFETCDRVRFSSLAADRLKMKDDLLELKEIIEYFERKKI